MTTTCLSSSPSRETPCRTPGSADLTGLQSPHQSSVTRPARWPHLVGVALDHGDTAAIAAALDPVDATSLVSLGRQPALLQSDATTPMYLRGAGPIHGDLPRIRIRAGSAEGQPIVGFVQYR